MSKASLSAQTTLRNIVLQRGFYSLNVTNHVKNNMQCFLTTWNKDSMHCQWHWELTPSFLSCQPSSAQRGTRGWCTAKKQWKNRNQTSFPTWVSSPLRPRTWSQSLDQGCSLCSAPQQNPCQAPPPSEGQTQWRSTKLFWNLVGPLQNDALDVVLQKGIHLILIMWPQTTITNQNYSFEEKEMEGERGATQIQRWKVWSWLQNNFSTSFPWLSLTRFSSSSISATPC